MKAKFEGTCDRFRQSSCGNNLWQMMMKTRKKISEKEFLRKVNVKVLLDEGETWKDYKEVARREGDPIKFYKSNNGLMFLQHAGFEFIWSI